MKKLALFDLDGTLFNTNDVNYHAYKSALEEKGFELDYQYFCNNCNGKHYTAFLPEIVKNDSEAMEYVHHRKKELYSSYVKKAIMNEHLFSWIEQIKENYYTAVVTRASKKNTYDILNFFHKVELFDLIITQEDITKVKPDPEGFLLAMKHFACEGKDTIIFEDSEVGIKAAMQTNASVCIVKHF